MIPRCEYELVVDEASISRAQRAHADKIDTLEGQVADHKATSELISFELQAGNSLVHIEA